MPAHVSGESEAKSAIDSLFFSSHGRRLSLLAKSYISWWRTGAVGPFFSKFGKSPEKDCFEIIRNSLSSICLTNSFGLTAGGAFLMRSSGRSHTIWDFLLYDPFQTGSLDLRKNEGSFRLFPRALLRGALTNRKSRQKRFNFLTVGVQQENEGENSPESCRAHRWFARAAQLCVAATTSRLVAWKRAY